jgi:exodeoxyribonuclease VII large subunit
MPVYQLRELNQHIRESIAEGYPEDLWVRAEIASLSINQVSGHCYLELGDGTARMRAVIWKSTWNEVSARLERDAGRKLETGMQVQVLGRVDFNIQYSMSFIIRDLDTAFTAGDLAMKRARALERLRKEGLLKINKEKVPVLPPARIALITSQTAAGYEDFVKHLLENPFGYRYGLQLFPSLMQGTEAIASIAEAFAALEMKAGEFDLAVIIRGGGSKQDLQLFDEFEVAAALAKCPLPVLSGIGHERDESLCDLVAWKDFKTPTAVADYILSLSSEAEFAVDQVCKRMAANLQWRLRNREQEITQESNSLFSMINRKCRSVEMLLQEEISGIARQGKDRLHSMELEIKGMESALRAGNPLRILELGFARISQEGKRIRALSELATQSSIKVQMKDGELHVKTIV